MSTIERITIALPKEMAEIVRDAVASGDYASNSEVLRDALRDWKLKRRFQEQEEAAFRAAVQEGLDDMRAGRMKAAEDVFARLEEKYAKPM